MYSVIRTDNKTGHVSDDDDDDDSDSDDGDSDVDPGRQVWRESKSRRRVLRTGGVPIGRMKTREETNTDQTNHFFSSKKIVSRQRNRNKEKNSNRSRKAQASQRRDKGEQEDTITGAKENVDERLQKVRHLFQLIKVSKKQKTKSQDREENVKSKFHNFPTRRRATARLGDNSNDAILVTRKEKKVSKVSALENLYKIAGEDWVKTHIE